MSSHTDIRLIAAIGLLAAIFCSCGREVRLERDDWAPDVKAALNGLLDECGGKPDMYAVFDFDNTTSIFDVQFQMIAYQLETMSFGLDPEGLRLALSSNLTSTEASYEDWIADITDAYSCLWESYGPFTPAGLDAEGQKLIGRDAQWMDFSSKLAAMYDLVSANEEKPASYKWLLQWFAGMSREEIYDVAMRSHLKYGAVETSEVTWAGPAMLATRLGPVTQKWISGIQVTENIRELWRALDANGIDVWVCSASGLHEIAAAVDAFGLHDFCTGVTGMTMTMDPEGRQGLDYDYTDGHALIAEAGGGWSEGTLSTRSQTAGPGKVTAILNAIAPLYHGQGPVAGFMDATGDFNFCTEFSSLRLVVCFNRATRKVTEGGGLIAETAIYERDVLGYDLAGANAAGDILYVLQGRDENGMRTFRPSNATIRFGESEERLFDGEENWRQLEHFKSARLSVKEILDTYSIRTAACAPHNSLGFEYGFLKDYNGYRSR